MPAEQPWRQRPARAAGRSAGTRINRGTRRGVALLPSLFTIANLFCGWACVVYAMRGELATAAPFIGAAIVLDMLDGRIARMTGTSSDFGVQLDSLADVISFGMAPAVLAFQWGLTPLGRLGWAVGFLFVTAAALRLARFNIQTHTDKRYFVGLASPAAAAIPASTVFAFPQGLTGRPEAFLALVMVLVPALLMVSTIRFRSFKTIDLGARRRFQVLVPLAALLALIVTFPQEVLLLMAYSYLCSGLVGFTATRLRRTSDPAPAAAAARPPLYDPTPATPIDAALRGGDPLRDFTPEAPQTPGR